MKITYTAPNRAHHYPFAEALYRAGHLHAFLTGFSRFSPFAKINIPAQKVKRHDFLQTIYLICAKAGLPEFITSTVNSMSASTLDRASLKWAKESNVFIYYRTEGYNTTRKLHRDHYSTLCAMEEVNSHVEHACEILKQEHSQLKIRSRFTKDPDYNLRLKTYEHSDIIICPSEFVRRSFLEKGFSPEKIIKVNFGLPPLETNVDQAQKQRDGTFRMLYVGQLNYRKGLRYAIEAFKQLRHPKKEFIIVGPKTPITGLETTTIPEGVFFKGTLKGERLKEQFRLADVFILPSLEEGLALVQGEALSFGLPLVITTNTGGEDFIKNGVEGFIVNPGNVIQLTSCLQRLNDEKDLLTNMSAAAIKAANKIGGWEKAVELLLSALNLAIAKK
jgi:alpha-maltose-1-phosphate synthase